MIQTYIRDKAEAIPQAVPRTGKFVSEVYLTQRRRKWRGQQRESIYLWFQKSRESILIDTISSYVQSISAIWYSPIQYCPHRLLVRVRDA